MDNIKQKIMFIKHIYPILILSICVYIYIHKHNNMHIEHNNTKKTNKNKIKWETSDLLNKTGNNLT